MGQGPQTKWGERTTGCWKTTRTRLQETNEVAKSSADERNRTSTAVCIWPLDPESSASANSATSAFSIRLAGKSNRNRSLKIIFRLHFGQVALVLMMLLCHSRQKSVLNVAWDQCPERMDFPRSSKSHHQPVTNTPTTLTFVRSDIEKLPRFHLEPGHASC